MIMKKFTSRTCKSMQRHKIDALESLSSPRKVLLKSPGRVLYPSQWLRKREIFLVMTVILKDSKIISIDPPGAKFIFYRFFKIISISKNKRGGHATHGSDSEVANVS